MTQKELTPVITDQDAANLKVAIKRLKALNHKIRRQILATIAANGSLSVTEIYVSLSLEQSVTSMHLKWLRDAKCVKAERKSKEIHYSINETGIEAILLIAKSLSKSGSVSYEQLRKLNNL